MCFRGNFSGGASAKDKGHRGHREWFLCSSGFQIIQRWYKGAFCLSFSPCPSLSLYLFNLSFIEFPFASLRRLSRDSPDQIKHPHSAPFVPTWDGFIRRSGVCRLQSGCTHTKATAGYSRPPCLSVFLFPSPCLSISFYPCGCAGADRTQQLLLKCCPLWRMRGSWLFLKLTKDVTVNLWTWRIFPHSVWQVSVPMWPDLTLHFLIITP